MVNAKFEVCCASCKKSAMANLSSLSGRGTVLRLGCEHWDIEMEYTGEAGWFFGANAKLSYELNVRCAKCGFRDGSAGKFWGWNNGEGGHDTLYCRSCAHAVVFSYCEPGCHFDMKDLVGKAAQVVADLLQKKVEKDMDRKNNKKK